MICPSCARDNPSENAFCPACGAALTTRDPRAYTPRHLAERILNSRAALEGERKQVTVLFSDVKGSTVLAEAVGPEEWHRILDGFFGILTQQVHRFEGTINQYTGDGVMALFGAPVAHEDHARRACHAALQIRARVKDFAAELASRGLDFSVRVGLHSGEVVVGKIGDDLRMDYTAQGAVVAQASRIEELAPPGCIWISSATAALVEGFVTLTDLGSQSLRGLREPVQLFQVEGTGPNRTSLDVGRARAGSALVGRERDLRELEASLAGAIDGQGQLVRVIGDAGIGKTRLCLEFVAHCRANQIPVFESSCPSDGRALSLLLGRELLRGYLDVASEAGDEDVRQQAEQKLGRIGLGEKRLLDAAFELLHVARPGTVRPDAPGSSREAEPDAGMLQLVHRLIQEQSAAQPTVWLIDDVQWIDAGSAKLLERMIDALGWTRTLMIHTQRSDFTPPWGAPSYSRSLQLTPLDPVDAEALVGALLGDDASLAGIVPLILERTLGNPFFAEEVVRELARSGSLSGEPGAYRASAALDDIQIPASIRALLAARIDALDERHKQVLLAAAVIGPHVDPEVLRALDDDSDVDAALDALASAGLLHDDGFAHPLIREVAYESQLADRRSETHAQVAVALERLHADKLGRVAERIAQHWEAAGKAWIARRWRQRAALRVTNIQTRSEHRGPRPGG